MMSTDPNILAVQQRLTLLKEANLRPPNVFVTGLRQLSRLARHFSSKSS